MPKTQFLSSSDYQLLIWPASDHRGTYKKPFKYLLRFIQDKLHIFCSIEQPLASRYSTTPKRVLRILPSWDPEQLPKIARRKKDRQFPQKLARVCRSLAANHVQPTFLSSHIFGGCQAKFSRFLVELSASSSWPAKPPRTGTWTNQGLRTGDLLVFCQSRLTH